ncbi:hypothetical protein KUTeg_014605 [Tegillarca granosa]|uniref:PiggyBac transposable element-derived protein domain-containing protein n=1 Tax=Tegillarca granosa TaxID=220873 RepID=A0ABQ9ERH1_TEGGR|nr:hypothetical protein KUTeg_014605 [Tegillarca granosa]
MDVNQVLDQVLNSDDESVSDINETKSIDSDISFSSPESTVRLNRRGMPQAIKNARLKTRGDSVKMQKGNLVCTSWKDKKLVTYLSTYSDPTQKHTVQRRQKDGTKKDVSAPQVSELYNKYMFRVDIADQKRMQYSTCRKAKKWYKYLFWFCFDLAVISICIFMKKYNKI